MAAQQDTIGTEPVDIIEQDFQDGHHGNKEDHSGNSPDDSPGEQGDEGKQGVKADLGTDDLRGQHIAFKGLDTDV